MKNKRTSGISLVALVVTIIVLIILTGAVIVTFMEGGIIDKANESVFKSDIRSYQEKLVTIRAVEQMSILTNDEDYEGPEVIGKTITEDDIKDIIPEFNVKNYGQYVQIVDGALVLVEGIDEDSKEYDWLEDLGIVEASEAGEGGSEGTIAGLNIGDKVVYTPNPEGVTIPEYTWDNDMVLETDTSIEWQYMGYIDNKHMLISNKPTEDGYWSGYGYRGGGSGNTIICETLYSGEGTTASDMGLKDVLTLLDVKYTTPFTNEYLTSIYLKTGTEVAPNADPEILKIVFGENNDFNYYLGEYFEELDYSTCADGHPEAEVISINEFSIAGGKFGCENYGYYCTNSDCWMNGGTGGTCIYNDYVGIRPIITINPETHTIKQVSGQWTVVAK